MSVYSTPRKLAPPGDEPYVRFEWNGPALYAQVGTTPVAAGGSPTNGDPLSALALGSNTIVSMDPAVTYTGNFLVLPIRVAMNKWILKWISLVSSTCCGQSQTAYTEAAASSTLNLETVKLVAHTLAG